MVYLFPWEEPLPCLSEIRVRGKEITSLEVTPTLGVVCWARRVNPTFILPLLVKNFCLMSEELGPSVFGLLHLEKSFSALYMGDGWMEGPLFFSSRTPWHGVSATWSWGVQQLRDASSLPLLG